MHWRSSLSSRAFSMAMTAWAAKFVTKAICLSVNGRTSWRNDRTHRSVLSSFNMGTARNVRIPAKFDGCNGRRIAVS